MPPAWPADRVERWPIDRLVPYARNARTHSAEQVSELAAAIREWGWTNPVLVDEDGGIIAGHGRVLAAKLLELTDVPVMIAAGWTEAQRRAYVLADNKLALNAGWDVDLLRLEAADISALGFDLGVAGFSTTELKAIAASGVVGATDPDDAPPLTSAAVTVQGETWSLGPHRLMCGDCRNPDHVARLVGDRRINIGFTSPPYAEQRDYDATSGFRPIPPREYVDWFAPVAANIADHLTADGSWFVNIKPPGSGLDTDLYVFDLVIAHVRAWGWHFATEFCWERAGVPKSVTQRFKNQFEPIYQFALGRWKMRPEAVRHASQNVPVAGGPGSGNTGWKTKQGGAGDGPTSVSGSFGAAKKRRNGTSKAISDVQGVAKDAGEYIGPGLAFPGNRLPTFTSSHRALGHAAAFPVGLPEFFLKAYTDPGDSVMDPFMGSGSTMIAAENVGRHAFGMELSPAYVDVAVRRWQSFTGKAATLEGDGRTFAEIEAERTAKAAA